MAKSKNKGIVHIGLDYNSALSAKKEILLSETHLLEIIKKMRAYSNLRKREFVLKNRIKKSLLMIGHSMLKIEDELPTAHEAGIDQESKISHGIKPYASGPEETIEKIEYKRVKSNQKEKNRKIEDELADIKQKLERLN